MKESAVAAVIGWPIGHSLSPRLFAHWFDRFAIAAHYVPLAIAPDDLGEVLPALAKAGFAGVNVTLPHKEAALALSDEATPVARDIGAANLLTFLNGRIFADNADGYGFIQNLRDGAPGWDPRAGPALVLGAGGASRAILHSLLQAGVPEIRLANRTAARAQAFADRDSRIRVVRWAEMHDAVPGSKLIVNTTSLGMGGQASLPLSLTRADPDVVVTDTVYTPLETPLLAEAREHGLIAVDGLGMLLHQARPAFDRWFGIDPPVDARLREAMLAP